MPTVFVRHRVKDFDAWKQAFDRNNPPRSANGIMSCTLFRIMNEPNEVALLMDVADLEKFHRFIRSEDLRQQIERAGVTEMPDIYIMNELERSPV